MIVRLLPLLSGLLPLLAGYLAFWIGVHVGVLPMCIPFIDGCASISAAGRNPPGSFLFKAVALPQSVLLLMTWYFTVVWIQALDENARRSSIIAIHVGSVITALSLILYVTFLGTEEPFYEFMRRFGIYLFFLGMVVTEILVAAALLRAPKVLQHAKLKPMAQLMLTLCLLPFALGLLNVYLKATLEDPNVPENAIEWIVATLMHSYLIVMFFMWRTSRFSLSASTDLR